MNESDWKPLTKDDPRLTAYALGELEGEELRRVEEALQADPDLRAEVGRIRVAGGAIKDALSKEAALARDLEWANSGRSRERRRRRSRSRRRFPGLYFIIGGLAAACVAVVVAVRRHDVEQADLEKSREVTISIRPADTEAQEAASSDSFIARRPEYSGGQAMGADGFTPLAPEGVVNLSLAVEDEGYARVRRLIGGGRLPTPSEVLVNDLVNAFSYDRASTEDSTLTSRIETGIAPWAPDHVLVRVQVDARKPVQVARPPTTMMILADIPVVPEQQARLDAIRENLRLLAKRLRPDDRLGIVAWTGQARVELEPTPISDQGAIQTAIDELGVLRGRRVDDALVTTLELAHGDAAGRGATWRVLICSDGGRLPDSDEPRALDLLENSETKKAFSRAVWGAPLQTGNRDFISRLADEGEAKEAVIGATTDAPRVLAGLIDDPVRVAATDTALKLNFDPSRVASYRILGYAAAGQSPRQVSGGEVLEGQSCTTLIEIVPKNPADASTAGLVRVSLAYHDTDADLSVERSFESPARLAWDASSADFKFSAAVAGFGLVLQEHQAGAALASLDRVQAWARAGTGDVPPADRSEFLGLLDSAKRMVH